MIVSGTIYRDDEYKSIDLKIVNGCEIKDDPPNTLEIVLDKDIKNGEKMYVSAKGLLAAISKAIEY